MLALRLIWSFLSLGDKMKLIDWLNVNNSNNQKFFIYVAKNENNEHAVKKITDHIILEDLAKNHENWRIRAAALEKITNHNILADIAKYEKITPIREKAHKMWKAEFNKLTDQKDFINIAKTHNYGEVRLAAIEKITDQNFLTNIAKNDKDWGARKAAVKNLTDDNVLFDVIKSDRNKDVREAAVLKLTDQTLLAEVAKNEKNIDIQKAVIEMITDPNHLRDFTAHYVNLFCTCESYGLKVDIGSLLKVLYKNNNLSQKDKSKILQLNGEVISEGAVIYKYKAEHADAICILGHHDIKFETREIDHCSPTQYFRL